MEEQNKKTCTRCKVEKHISVFHPGANICRECHTAARQKTISARAEIKYLDKRKKELRNWFEERKKPTEKKKCSLCGCEFPEKDFLHKYGEGSTVCRFCRMTHSEM